MGGLRYLKYIMADYSTIAYNNSLWKELPDAHFQ
jgi:hypothetical protein